MYLIGILYLTVAAIASPVIPNAPYIPPRGVVFVETSVLGVPEPKVVKIIEFIPEEKKDEDNAEKPKIAILEVIPEAPVLPPLDLSVIETFKKQEIKKVDDSLERQNEEDENKEEESKENDVKNQKFIKDGVDVEVKDYVKDETPVVTRLSIPTPPFISNIISIFPKPPLSWPFQLPSFLKPPKIRYPGYIVEEIV